MWNNHHVWNGHSGTGIAELGPGGSRVKQHIRESSYIHMGIYIACLLSLKCMLASITISSCVRCKGNYPPASCSYMDQLNPHWCTLCWKRTCSVDRVEALVQTGFTYSNFIQHKGIVHTPQSLRKVASVIWECLNLVICPYSLWQIFKLAKLWQ